jgi:Flp pilus assembly protein TadG
MRKLPRLLRNERGQILIMAVALLPVLVGMVGVAVDVGTYADHRRDLQNDADSIALAAAQDLPTTADAQAAADTWAAKNGLATGDYTVTITGGSTAPKVTVAVTRPHNFSFIKILGVNEKDVSARAAAVKVSFGGGAGIVPWSVTQATVDSTLPGNLITMKYDSTGSNLGNFGAIRIDGPGANTYNTSVMYGSSTVACAETAPNCTTGACPGSYPNTCSETSPECDGPECTPETGNVIGPTRTGVDFRMNNTMTTCDSFTEVFPSQQADGTYNINQDCNPYTDGAGKCDSPTDICSRRVIIIPVVDTFGNGASDPASIQRFALVFLEGYDAGKCQGNSCEIKGRFVKADLSPRGLAGSYDPTALIHFTKLSE